MENKKIVTVEVLESFNDGVAKVDRKVGDRFECDIDRAIYLSNCVINGVKYYLVKIVEDEVVVNKEDIIDPSDIKEDDEVIDVETEKVTVEETAEAEEIKAPKAKTTTRAKKTN